VDTANGLPPHYRTAARHEASADVGLRRAWQEPVRGLGRGARRLGIRQV